LSVTCSVHSVPDQYRCSCLKKGSANHPGAVPVVVGSEPWGPLGGPAAEPGRFPLVNELPGPHAPLRPPRRRWEAIIRITNVPAITTRKIHEPWP
jgi:hypothetical protein